ncbi:16S rRNA (cytidine(1402)-2'-O)-methyltransferase [Alicyclobacillus fastidiosus]|uniref:Ribosomal RNA small subunit methyltransferase I n=1 Tax=Alicyclobacillus fastidiosus TaxID=392011 RepID=A0ABY6ZI39_9BACL|nr:16S rRNA (cytidine(1402)-2'-O)-methyltransferase [Alicyclobacillus fastidiosus]WAH42187.1 16S rRNA (cytidine(1402)-2'-O)-methyltransferase [Alicyclobacillus fastidiosus]GMA63978.1 ribosomal RNA small subunit methyltransferase I [Alicyclobacillus fastidiosus]
MVHVVRNNADEGPKLYVCSTPIGNLSDVSHRLLDTLRSVDVVACEDTRHTRKLLTHFDIHPEQLISYHQHNEQSRQGFAQHAWDEGKSIALVSDAGTPLLSDPGAIIVDTAIERGIPVIPVPGPSALLAGLVGSGLPMTPFVYLGFPPRSAKGAKEWLTPFLPLPATLVMYESPHRLHATLLFLREQLGDKNAVLAKELTKQYETFVRGTLSELVLYSEEESVRGEFVILVDNRGSLTAEVSPADQMEEAVKFVVDRVAAGERHKSAVQAATEKYGVNRRALYNETLSPEET